MRRGGAVRTGVVVGGGTGGLGRKLLESRSMQKFRIVAKSTRYLACPVNFLASPAIFFGQSRELFFPLDIWLAVSAKKNNLF